MSNSYTIGKLADAGGVKVSTLRYYEREGLLKAPARSTYGYRLYDRDSLERLRFIRAAQAAGFSLGDIASLLRLRDRKQPPCENVRDLIDARLDDVDRQLDDLRRVQAELRQARRSCEAEEGRQTCAVLDRLDAAAEDPESPEA